MKAIKIDQAQSAHPIAAYYLRGVRCPNRHLGHRQRLLPCRLDAKCFCFHHNRTPTKTPSVLREFRAWSGGQVQLFVMQRRDDVEPRGLLGRDGRGQHAEDQADADGG
jgi:hypothetical protein